MESIDHQRLIEKLKRIEPLCPEFVELDRTLQSDLTEETNRVIAESIGQDISDVEVRSGQALPAAAAVEAADGSP